MAFRAPIPERLTLCNRFKGMLSTKWARPAACGNKYKDTPKVLEWMKAAELGNTASNADLLLKEVFGQSPHDRGIPPPTISHKELLFSALVEIDHGDLVKIFGAHIDDLTLWQADYYFSAVRDGLKRAGVKDVESVVAQFDAVRWAYCTPMLKLDDYRNFSGGKWILPFCRRVEITEKGGTAQLWKVAIRQEHVRADLRNAISRSKYMDQEFGWVCFSCELVDEVLF